MACFGLCKTPGYAVRGIGAGGGFDSTALAAEAVYTHAFGVPGGLPMDLTQTAVASLGLLMFGK